MSKRRLSQRQQLRIVEKQQRELGSTGNASDTATPASRCNGRVVSHFGQQLDVEPLPYESTRPTVRCFQRANLPPLVTGDLVVWEAEETGGGVIVAVAARKSEFGRPAFGGQFKPMAANIDKVVVVIAPLPEPFMNLIDRYLVAIETLGLTSVLVANKWDLATEVARLNLDSMLSEYGHIGYEVHRVSAQEGSGLDSLQQSLHGQVTVLVGQSGVGKSSLINRLGDGDVALVGAMSTAMAKGTHTTTTARLFHLGAFDLVDSPGIREFSLGHISQDQLFAGFREFQPYTGQCKFRDCGHQSEPGCAIRAAAEAGAISRQRLQSYLHILQTLDNP